MLFSQEKYYLIHIFSIHFLSGVFDFRNFSFCIKLYFIYILVFIFEKWEIMF
jgi:hypothetical protein